MPIRMPRNGTSYAILAALNKKGPLSRTDLRRQAANPDCGESAFNMSAGRLMKQGRIAQVYVLLPEGKAELERLGYEQ